MISVCSSPTSDAVVYFLPLLALGILRILPQRDENIPALAIQFDSYKNICDGLRINAHDRENGVYRERGDTSRKDPSCSKFSEWSCYGPQSVIFYSGMAWYPELIDLHTCSKNRRNGGTTRGKVVSLFNLAVRLHRFAPFLQYCLQLMTTAVTFYVCRNRF